jgi:hypothetical protein
MLRYFVPILFRYAAFGTSLLDLVQPFFDRHILLWIAIEDWSIFPVFIDGLKVERFDLECVEHDGVRLSKWYNEIRSWMRVRALCIERVEARIGEGGEELDGGDSQLYTLRLGPSLFFLHYFTQCLPR